MEKIFRFIEKNAYYILCCVCVVLFCLHFPFNIYIGGGDSYPIFYTLDFLQTQVFSWTSSTTFGSISAQSINILLSPFLLVLQFVIDYIGFQVPQFMYYMILFVALSSGMFFLMRSLKFDKLTSLQGAFFYGFSFLVRLGITRNTLHINALFLFTPFILALIILYIESFKKKYLLAVLVLGYFNIYIVANPWTWGIQIISILFFVICKYRLGKIKHLILPFVSLYVFSFIGFFSFILTLFNSSNIQKDDRNNVVLKEGGMIKEKLNSSLLNTNRGFNGDLFDVWGYIDLKKDLEFYTPFPYAKLYKTDMFTIISFIPLFLIILGFLWGKRDKKFFKWMFLFLFSIFLISGVGSPFGFVFEYCLNNIPMCGIFRAPHQKFSIIYVLSLIILLALLAGRIKYPVRKRFFNILLWLYVILMGSFHFFYPYISRQNLLKHIPVEYKQTANFVNKNKDIKNIIVLPFNEGTWTNTEFGYEGYHLFAYLLPKHQIYNRNDLAFSSFAKNIHEVLGPEINKRGEKTLEYMNNYYIDTLIYDAYTDRYTRFAHKEEHEENLKWLDALTGLDKLGTFGKLHIYHIKSYAILNLPNALSFSKINPTKYQLSIKSLSGSQELSFLQSFHPQRKLYLSNPQLTCEEKEKLIYNSYEYLTGGAATYTGLINLTGLVQRGDSRSNLAQKNNLSITQLRRLNPQIKGLEPNQEIILGQKEQLISPESRIIQTGTGNITECVNKDYTFFEGEELKYLREKPVFDDTHQLVNDYANGRTLDAEYIKKNFPKEYYNLNPDGSIDVNLTLYFKPQSYFYLGLGVSGLTFLGLITRLIIDRRKQKKSDSK